MTSDKPQNIVKLERESGARKVGYLIEPPRYLCCDSLMREGHEIICENFPMEAP